MKQIKRPNEPYFAFNNEANPHITQYKYRYISNKFLHLTKQKRRVGEEILRNEIL